MKNYVNRNIELVSANGDPSKTCEVSLVDEHNLKLYVNGKLKKEFICLNENLDDIVLGWLIGKNFIRNQSQIVNKEYKNNNIEVYVEIKSTDKANEEIENFSKVEFRDKWIFDIVNEFLEGTKIHKHTSGTHCCILSIKGKTALKIEDIGRHNAIDKVIGYIYKNNIVVSDCMLFTSGRISTDLVEKVINARIPILVSKSVTSFQAAEMAKGRLHLICKAWPDSFEIYS